MLKSNRVRINLFLLGYLYLSSYTIFKTTKQTYGVNDDVIIQSWLSGTYTGNPEPMIRGSATPKILFGYLFSSLYRYFPNINWFTLAMLFFVLLSWYFIGLIIFRTKNLLNILFYLITTFTYLFWFIPSPTYTASAILLASSVLFYFIQNELKIFSIFLLAIVYSMSYLIRPESFIFGSIVLIPMICYSLIWIKKINKNQILLFMLITFFIIMIDGFLENSYYKNNSDWQNYKPLESARYAIQANRVEELLLKNPNKYGWSYSQAILFSQYLTLDKNTFNTQNYQKIIEKTNNETKIQLNVINFIFEGHSQMINSDVNWEWFNLAKLIPLSFIFYFLFSYPKDIKYFLITTLTFCILYLMMIYVAIYLRQPERLQVSAIFLATLIPLFIYNTLNYKIENIKIESTNLIANFILYILIINFTFNQIIYFDKKYAGANSAFWQIQIDFFEGFPKNSIFIGNSSQFRSNWANPYMISDEKIEERIFTLGWHNFSPHWIKRANNLGLNPDNLIESIINDDNIYFVTDSFTLEYIKNYLMEKKVLFSNIYKINSVDFVGNDYSVWKISK